MPLTDCAPGGNWALTQGVSSVMLVWLVGCLEHGNNDKGDVAESPRTRESLQESLPSSGSLMIVADCQPSHVSTAVASFPVVLFPLQWGDVQAHGI